MIRFTKGDRVKVKRGDRWYTGSVASVREAGEGMCGHCNGTGRVTFDAAVSVNRDRAMSIMIVNGYDDIRDMIRLAQREKGERA